MSGVIISKCYVGCGIDFLNKARLLGSSEHFCGLIGSTGALLPSLLFSDYLAIG